MSPADCVLGALTGVRRSGPDRWSAVCPAHADRRPSLSVRELDDGRVLLHCFGGCAVDEVVTRLGLTLADLYPADRPGRSPGSGAPPERRPWSAADLLRLAAFESTVVAVGLCDAMVGRRVDFDRLLLAAETLGSIAEVTHAPH
jgi:hypothetical protein